MMVPCEFERHVVLDVGYILHTYLCMTGYCCTHVNSLVSSVSVMHILYLYLCGW